MNLRETERTDSTNWSSIVETTLGGSETILFVEDEVFVRNVTSEILCAAGYTVLSAASASEALSLYGGHQSNVDLLLTDVILPGENGRALARKLRLHHPELNVLFITGYAEQLEAVGEEMTECLPKPFSTEVLLKKIRELLDQHRTLPQSWRSEFDRLKRVCGNA
jgi:two-component system, cell cycle sensor histidine kinase and response regulator CckA